MTLPETEHAVEPHEAEVMLRERLAGHRMVFELGFDEQEFRAWRRPLFVALRRWQVREIRQKHPALLVTYMAYAGTFLYEGGEYWTDLHPTLKALGAEAGRHFLGAVRALNLEPFDRIVSEDHGLTWVSRILAQGGIPRSCLQPFAELITREVEAGIADGAELLSAWRTRRASLTQLHAPTRRFLLYGGDEAIDLVDRCIELLRDVARTGQRPSAAEAGLPQYVVEAFERVERRHDRPRVARRDGLANPQLRLEPYDALGPVIVLPPVAPDQLGGVWRVQSGDRVHRQEPSSYSAETIKVSPAAVADVEFLTSEGIRRHWAFDVLASRSVMFFDPATQGAVRDARALAAEEIWALAPAGTTFLVDGQPAREIQQLPAPTGAWTGFAIHHLDLRGVTKLGISDDQGPPQTIQVTPPRARPALAGSVIAGVLAEGDAAVYASPPSLHVPGAADGLAWSLRVRGPHGERSATTAPNEEGLIELRELLPDDPFGVYRLRARGPIGSDLTARFAVVEGLTIDRPHDVVFPGGEPPRVTVRAPGLCGAQDEEPGATQTITLAEDTATNALARLRHPSGRTIDLMVAVPRVLWTIVHDTKPALQVGTRVVRVDAEEFDDQLADTLLVNAGRPGVLLALELRDRRDNTVAQLPAVETVGENGRWAFDLGPIAGAIQAASGSRMALWLQVGSRHVHAADIVCAAHVQGLRVSCTDNTVRVEFEQDRPINDRIVRLWSNFQPWLPSVRLPIPDGQETVSAPLDEHLPPGSYLAEVAVDDPWITVVRPSALEPAARMLSIGDRDAVRAWLESLDPADPLTLVTWVLARHRADTAFDIFELRERATQVAIAFRALLDDCGPGHPPGRQFASLASVASARDAVLVAMIGAAGELEGQTGWLDRLDLRLLEHIDPTFDPLDENEMARAWRACPGVATRLDLPWAESDEQARDRCRRYLGWVPGEPLPDPGGAQVRQLELHMPAEQLRDMRFALGLQPAGLLDAQTRMLGTFDWLLTQQESATGADDGIPRRWYGKYRHLMSVHDTPMPVVARTELERHLDVRKPPRGTEAWAGVAAVLLGAAIHHRWGEDAARYEALSALEEAMPWARRLIRSDHVLLTALSIATDQPHDDA